MKKVWKILLLMAALAGVVALMLIPGKEVRLDDGGSHYRKSLLRMEAEWFYVTTTGDQTISRVYWFPDTLKSANKLWEEARTDLKPQFIATVLEVRDNSVLVKLDETSAKKYGSDQITFNIANLEKINVQAGSRVKVTFGGEVMESYPAQIVATGWELLE